MTTDSVLGRLHSAFPNQFREVTKSKYWSFNFGRGATIYIPFADPHRAHITLSSLDNDRFPNSDRLRAYAESQNVHVHGNLRLSKGEYWFRSQHIDRVIAILRGE